MWTNKDHEWWQEEYRAACERRTLKDETIQWCASLPWTHLYHQTFKREITNGQSAISVVTKFLTEHRRSFMLDAALIVAERHPFRAEKNRRSSVHHSSLATCSPRKSSDSRTNSTRSRTRRLQIETDYEGRRGFLYHIHGLLCARYSQAARSYRASSTESSLRVHGSRKKRDSFSRSQTSFQLRPLPFYQMVNETAYRELGIARVWPLRTGSEIAGTVYAIKYILKSQRLHRVTPEEYEPTPVEDDWTILKF